MWRIYREVREGIPAVLKVQAIGLSFGGECFFETGVTPTNPFTNEAFSSMFSEQ